MAPPGKSSQPIHRLIGNRWITIVFPAVLVIIIVGIWAGHFHFPAPPPAGLRVTVNHNEAHTQTTDGSLCQYDYNTEQTPLTVTFSDPGGCKSLVIDMSVPSDGDAYSHFIEDVSSPAILSGSRPFRHFEYNYTTGTVLTNIVFNGNIKNYGGPEVSGYGGILTVKAITMGDIPITTTLNVYSHPGSTFPQHNDKYCCPPCIPPHM